MKLGVTEQPDSLEQGSHRAYGVVLRRREGSRASQELLLFLKGMGCRRISAPGAEGPKNRFGGGTEPLMWGTFDFYQSPRRLYLKGVDVREDYLLIRRSIRKLHAAVMWCKLLAETLPIGIECDDLLALFRGSLQNLAHGADPSLVGLRFVWRWGALWGVAPSLEYCCACGEALGTGEGERASRCGDGLLCRRCAAAAREDAVFSSLDGGVLREIRAAAMLPRGQFLAWAKSRSAENAPDLGVYARWFQTFLTAYK